MAYTELSAQLFNAGELVAVSSINLIQVDGAGEHTLALVPPSDDPNTGNVYQLIVSWKPVEEQ